MKTYIDEIRIQVIIIVFNILQVNKYYDVLIEFIEEFQSSILSDQLNDTAYLRQRFQELIDRKGNELQQVYIFKTSVTFDSVIQEMQRKLLTEK